MKKKVRDREGRQKAIIIKKGLFTTISLKCALRYNVFVIKKMQLGSSHKDTTQTSFGSMPLCKGDFN